MKKEEDIETNIINQTIESVKEDFKIDNSKCAKECCTQYWGNEEKESNVASNFSCNSGCLCLNQKQLDNLSSRGGNKI